MATKNSVLYYTTGIITLPIQFPENKVVCQYCEFCYSEDSLKRHRCRLTREMLLYPTTSRGNQCPINFESEVKDA